MILAGCGGVGRWIGCRRRLKGQDNGVSLGACLPSCRTSALSGGDEDEHPLDVPGHGDEAPFAARAIEAAQGKLTESQRRFDDPEHRLRDLLAQRVKRPACRRLQPMRHRLDRRWILRRFPTLSKPVVRNLKLARVVRHRKTHSAPAQCTRACPPGPWSRCWGCTCRLTMQQLKLGAKEGEVRASCVGSLPQ